MERDTKGDSAIEKERVHDRERERDKHTENEK